MFVKALFEPLSVCLFVLLLNLMLTVPKHWSIAFVSLFMFPWTTYLGGILATFSASLDIELWTMIKKITKRTNKFYRLWNPCPPKKGHDLIDLWRKFEGTVDHFDLGAQVLCSFRGCGRRVLLLLTTSFPGNRIALRAPRLQGSNQPKWMGIDWHRSSVW